ncbi:MAG TPA: RICIN domain-containing protein [Pseudonocardiaceae bacterium]|nr:RICIN domain-containing protein [Pseudonocardiaceae bacterium]
MVEGNGPALDVKLRLGVLDIGMSNIRWRKGTGRRPFMIVDRFKGLALDTAHRHDPGSMPIMWPPNGEVQQLWRINRVRGTREYTITSVQNGLRLDAGDEFTLSRHPAMTTPKQQSTQRWGFVPGPEKIGCLILSSYSGHALDFPRKDDRDRPPHLFARNNELQQQFLLLVPAVSRMANW